MGKQKVVLAFSGGLDTSFCVKYLSEDKGYDVYTAIANTGGFSKEELANIEKRAVALGAVRHATLDIEQEYYEKSIKYMIYGDILRNGTYPISVSSERIFQAIAIIEYAKRIGADAVARLRRSGTLTREQAERALAFCNNSGPAFLVGACLLYTSPSPRDS